jgi:site-specific recombinase XerD
MIHKHMEFLKHARQFSEHTVNSAALYVAEFDRVNSHRDFRKLTPAHVIAYKKFIGEKATNAHSQPLSKISLHKRIRALREFFTWLSDQPGYRTKIRRTTVAYFTLSNHDVRIAQAQRSRPVLSLEQIRHILSCMPATTPIEMRDRAVVAFTALSAARVDAIASMRLRNVDVIEKTILQDARIVRTKFRKSFTSNFYPVGEDIEAIVVGWIQYLRRELHFGPDDPLFPSTAIVYDDTTGLLNAHGLTREPWKSAGTIRLIFKRACENAGLLYHNPHSVRATIARLGERVCKTPEEFKSWSQSLGHSDVSLTLNSYGQVPEYRQTEVFGEIRKRISDTSKGAK